MSFYGECPGPVNAERCIHQSDSGMPNATLFCFECDRVFRELAAKDSRLAALYRAQRRATRAAFYAVPSEDAPEHGYVERFGPAESQDIVHVAEELKAACIELRLEHRAGGVEAEA